MQNSNTIDLQALNINIGIKIDYLQLNYKEIIEFLQISNNFETANMEYLMQKIIFNIYKKMIHNNIIDKKNHYQLNNINIDNIFCLDIANDIDDILNNLFLTYYIKNCVDLMPTIDDDGKVHNGKFKTVLYVQIHNNKNEINLEQNKKTLAQIYSDIIKLNNVNK